MVTGMARYMRRRSARLLANERGQDLIEYALLTGIIAIITVFLAPTFLGTMKTAYLNRNNAVNAIAEPNAPIP